MWFNRAAGTKTVVGSCDALERAWVEGYEDREGRSLSVRLSPLAKGVASMEKEDLRGA
jgi:hypothetical protein